MWPICAICQTCALTGSENFNVWLSFKLCDRFSVDRAILFSTGFVFVYKGIIICFCNSRHFPVCIFFHLKDIIFSYFFFILNRLITYERMQICKVKLVIFFIILLITLEIRFILKRSYICFVLFFKLKYQESRSF